MADSKQVQFSPAVSTIKFAESEDKKVIGIYGLPGSGKSFLLTWLKKKLYQDPFVFYEGSELIASLVPGGLATFQKLNEQEKLYWRQQAIIKAKECAPSEHAVVIAGHYMFWKEGDAAGTPVITQQDLSTYTHILYLDIPAELIVGRRRQDRQEEVRDRPDYSVSHLNKWQQTEKTDLRRLCYDHNILFSVVNEGPGLRDQVSRLLNDFRNHTESKNQSLARAALDKVFAVNNHQPKSLIVFDADRTLASVDTGALFWKTVNNLWPSKVEQDPLKVLFSGRMKYTYNAFRQAMLLYEECVDDQQFNAVCKKVASMTTMYAEFVSLLQVVLEQDTTDVVIITCGLRRVWEEVLERNGLSDKIKVIGGGRLANDLVVTPDIKSDVVSYAKDAHCSFVCAFGDSPLDLGMLKKADRAIVVVGEERSRSQTMDAALSEALKDDAFRACAYQVLLPATVSPRLSPGKLPITQLTGSKLVGDILRLQPRCAQLHFTHATYKNAAKLLTTATRDARNVGPILRDAHKLAGRYLATEFLSDSNVHGVEEYVIPHVQGNQAIGYRLLHEENTLIVPLMRGGEPMAFGVNDVLPNAMFHHAKQPKDLLDEHLHGRLSVILVDSVVNTGKSVIEFVQHIRGMHATIRIIVITGVVQSGAVAILENEPCCRLNFKLVALRLSDNKFTGKGATDTGNRLFNTCHLD